MTDEETGFFDLTNKNLTVTAKNKIAISSPR